MKLCNSNPQQLAIQYLYKGCKAECERIREHIHDTKVLKL